MGGGVNSQQAHDVVTTSMRRNDVASTSFRRRVPTRFLINQCQIITFLILKYDIIEHSRIELRGIVLPVQVGGLLGGQRVCWPPSQIIGGPGPPAPPPPLFLRLCYTCLLLGHSDVNWCFFLLRYFSGIVSHPGVLKVSQYVSVEFSSLTHHRPYFICDLFVPYVVSLMG